MTTKHQTFTLAEKLAVVHLIDSVIKADEIIHTGEINALGHLMQVLNFDSNFILQSRNLEQGQCLTILDTMSKIKKRSLGDILEEVAISDGFIHEKETKLLGIVFSALGIMQEVR